MTVIDFPTAVQVPARIQCTQCGAETDAACDCNAPYVSAAKRIADYDKANPGQSTRVAGAALGVSKSEVSRARSGVPSGAPDAKVTGQDGKKYSAKTKTAKPPADEVERDRAECIALYKKAQDAERDRAQWLLDHPQAPVETITTAPTADELGALRVRADSDEMAGAYLEALGPDRFFAVLQYAPKLRAEIERRVINLYASKTPDKTSRARRALDQMSTNGADPEQSADAMRAKHAAAEAGAA